MRLWDPILEFEENKTSGLRCLLCQVLLNSSHNIVLFGNHLNQDWNVMLPYSSVQAAATKVIRLMDL